MLADASVEPLSATIGWKPAGIRDSTQGSASSSFRQGRMTSILTVPDRSAGTARIDPYRAVTYGRAP